MRSYFILFLLCFYTFCFGQKKITLSPSFSVGCNASWLRGHNGLEIPFSTTYSAVPQFGVIANLQNAHEAMIGFRIEGFRTEYYLNTIDIFNRPFLVHYNMRVEYTGLFIKYNYKLLQKYNTKIGIGFCWDILERYKPEAIVQNMTPNDWVFPSPNHIYGIKKNNHSIQFSVHQPLFRIGYCDFEIETMYLHGLNNINKYSDENRLYTRNIMMFFNCVLRPKKKR